MLKEEILIIVIYLYKKKHNHHVSLNVKAAEITLQPHEETYYDSGDICCLCQFRLNDPLQRNKPKMKCPQCHAIVHKPSFVKDRSEMGLVGCLNCNP